MKKRILFLDIDGVLNTTQDLNRLRVCDFHSAIYEGRPFDRARFNFNQDCIDNLKAIIDKVDNLTIVVSSNWRYGVTNDNLLDMFRMFGIIPKELDMIDNTLAEDSLFKRSFIISKYLYELKKKNIDYTFACVDDRIDLYHYEFYNHLALTHPDRGLDDIIKIKIIDMLK